MPGNRHCWWGVLHVLHIERRYSPNGPASQNHTVGMEVAVLLYRSVSRTPGYGFYGGGGGGLLRPSRHANLVVAHGSRHGVILQRLVLCPTGKSAESNNS